VPSQVGTILAQSFISLEAGSHLHGAALSLNSAVTITSAHVTLERDGVVNAYNASLTTSQTPQASESLTMTPSSIASQVRGEFVLAACISATADFALAEPCLGWGGRRDVCCQCDDSVGTHRYCHCAYGRVHALHVDGVVAPVTLAAGHWPAPALPLAEPRALTWHWQVCSAQELNVQLG